MLEKTIYKEVTKKEYDLALLKGGITSLFTDSYPEPFKELLDEILLLTGIKTKELLPDPMSADQRVKVALYTSFCITPVLEKSESC